MDELEILESNAIDVAIKSNWALAIELNTKILTIDKKNVQALLRIAFSYLKISNYEESKKYYHKALRLQPKNAVAKQYLEKIEILEQGKSKPQVAIIVDPHLFIESFGKTKTASLANLGQKQILARLSIGQQVVLKIKKRRVEIRTEADEYVGTLADDISKRLILFIKAKTIYSAFIKEVHFTKVVVFIREDKKGKTVVNYISFPTNLQNNIEQIGGPNMTPNGEQIQEEVDTEEEDDTTINDWEKMAAEQTEEKEVLIDIQPEDLNDEDEDG